MILLQQNVVFFFLSLFVPGNSCEKNGAYTTDNFGNVNSNVGNAHTSTNITGVTNINSIFPDDDFKSGNGGEKNTNGSAGASKTRVGGGGGGGGAGGSGSNANSSGVGGAGGAGQIILYVF
jgi:hypothetical protein